MSIFPSIEPSTRVWSPGERPQSLYESLDGIEVRFVHGSRTTKQRLSLTFSNITEAQGKSITDHYAANGTTYGTFDLPAEVFAGQGSYGYTNESDNAWRYSAPPRVTYGRPGYQSVSIELLGVAA
jgi:hypothetical protein